MGEVRNIRCESGPDAVRVCYGICGYYSNDANVHPSLSMSKLLILNDQGGGSISCEKQEVSPTLRAQDHGHPPIVIYEKGNTNSD